MIHSVFLKNIFNIVKIITTNSKTRQVLLLITFHYNIYHTTDLDNMIGNTV